MDNSKIEEIARMVVATTSPFKEFKVQSFELRKCSGSFPKDVADKQVERLLAEKPEVLKENPDRANYGTWDMMDLELKVNSTYGMHPANFIELSEKMERLTTFKLNYFTISVNPKKRPMIPVLRLCFHSYAEVSTE